MDERFPRWLRVVVDKLEFLAIPNLGMLVAGLAIFGFVGKVMLGDAFYRVVYEPHLVMQGEWWRLFAFPIPESFTNPLFLLLFVWYVYYTFAALEGTWGAGPLTVFTGVSYLAALGASFIAMRPIDVWSQIMNVSLAFGTLFPDIEFLLFFILPVKAKWLAMLAGGMLVLQFLGGDVFTKLYILVLISPYLIFFTPLLVAEIRSRRKIAQNRRRFSDDWR